MKLCSNCGANIDGLVYWCDCCGAKLSDNNYICLFDHNFKEAGDISRCLKDTVSKLEQLKLDTVSSSISKIELVTYCYPTYLVEELKIKNSMRFWKKDRRARITIIFDYESYIKKTREEKERYVTDAVMSRMLALFRKQCETDFERLYNLVASVQIDS